jgi:hypothetical protein
MPPAKKAVPAAAKPVPEPTPAPPAELDKPADKVEGETPPPADDSAGDGPAAADSTVDSEPEEFVVPETGSVDVPCRVCYPNGWPCPEPDAWVNCAHNFGIRYGAPVEITRERAVELGFLEADPT